MSPSLVSLVSLVSLASLLLLLSAASVPGWAAPNEKTEWKGDSEEWLLRPTIDPRVWDDVQDGGVARFLLQLRDHVDWSAARRFRGSRELLGRMVLDKARDVTRRSQRDVLSALENMPGVEYVLPMYVANVIFVDGNRGVVEQLMNRRDIRAIRSNRPFRVPLETPDDLQFPKATRDNEWNIDYIGAQNVWAAGFTGEGAIVGNADTGIDYTHRDLLPNYYGNKNGTIDHNFAWWDGVKRAALPGIGECRIDNPEPCDDNGHGTHTVGTAIGQNGIGVAPGAKWMGCRNMDRGFGSPESYMSCLQFFLAPHDLNGENANPSIRPNSIGNSYGCPPAEGCTEGDEFTEAVEALRAAGVFMSVSAGNDGPSCQSILSPPGTEPSVISVGATGYQSDAIAAFSSRGDVNGNIKPEIVAPGSSVLSSVPGGGYSSYSGTSMASPHVAGAVGLLASACPSISYDVDRIQEVLEQTAKPLNSDLCDDNGIPNNVYGHGLLQVDDAVTLCSKFA